MFQLLFVSLSGQQVQVNIGELKNEAMTRYNEGNYKEAHRGFSVLSDKYPGDAMYRYYLGICLVKLNMDLPEAIEHLYFASSRGVPEDSYYYLGLAYHREYNFSEAEKFFRRFEKEASRQKGKEFNIRHHINTSRSAREITSLYNPFRVLNVAFISLYDSVQFSQVKMRGGNLTRKPERFFAEFEDRNGLNSLMFMPDHHNRGEYVYFAGYLKNDKEGTELFRVRKKSAGTWTDPEPIKLLNTGMDELFPYFDPIESDLYFASNGLEGIGGFDLYKSHYDAERDEYSEPMNLGFPINSAMDDYIFLPGNDLGMVMFFSARQARDSMVTVYRTHLIEPRQPVSPSDTRQLKHIALLGGAAQETLAEIESFDKREKEKTIAQESPGKTDKVAVTYGEQPEPERYQTILSKALRHQAVSDSLSGLATEAKIRVRESDDPNDRWVWQKQIVIWEKRSGDEQERADELYLSLREGKEKKKPQDYPETIKVDTIINGITVYTYTNPGETYQAEVIPVKEPVIATRIKDPRADNLPRFEILASSPYSDTNPVPFNVTLPSGVFYRIQLGAFGSKVAHDAFGGLSPLTGEYIQESGLFK
ncbi:MAG TPA: hypothetical protein ENN61_00770, partial [Bacteroidaceae bacterium]|nr:hypothetical protein [Bacteroidaceae bacterium]